MTNAARSGPAPRQRRALCVTLLLLATATAVRAQSPTRRAAIVVVQPDGALLSRCVPLAETTVTGFELLARSGLDVTAGALGPGAAVCAIEGAGCPADDCFCECQGGDCHYWSYWHFDDGAWRYATAGAGSYQIEDGFVDGWVWGPGAPGAAPPPPPVRFEEICAPAEASPAATGPAAAVARPTATPIATTPAPVTEGASRALAYLSLAAILFLLAAIAVGARRRRDA